MAATKDFQALYEARALANKETLEKAQEDQKTADATEAKIKLSHLEQQKAVDEIRAAEAEEKAEAEAKRIDKAREKGINLAPSDREQTPALPTNPSDTDPLAIANFSNPEGAAEKSEAGGAPESPSTTPTPRTPGTPGTSRAPGTPVPGRDERLPY